MPNYFNVGDKILNEETLIQPVGVHGLFTIHCDAVLSLSKELKNFHL